MRCAAYAFGLTTLLLGFVGCTQLLALDDATVVPSEDANVALPIPDGMAVDVPLDLPTEASDVMDETEVMDVSDASEVMDAESDVVDGKPVKDSVPPPD